MRIPDRVLNPIVPADVCDINNWLTCKEVADMHGVATATVETAVHSNRLNSIKLFNLRLIHISNAKAIVFNDRQANAYIPPDGYYTIKTVADLIGMTPSGVDSLIRRGGLTMTKMDGNVVVSDQTLKAYLDTRNEDMVPITVYRKKPKAKEEKPA